MGKSNLSLGILLVGKMGSGKGVLSDMICNQYNYNRHSMADWLKKTIQKHYNLTELRKNDLIKLGSGKEITVREAFQLFGTEAIRNFDSNWHLDEVINSIEYNIDMSCMIDHLPYKFIIDDIRFLNEADVLSKKYNCIKIRIETDEPLRMSRLKDRDGTSPTKGQMSHTSETELDSLPTNYIITNNGTVEELETKLKEIIKHANR